jgi:integrase
VEPHPAQRYGGGKRLEAGPQRDAAALDAPALLDEARRLLEVAGGDRLEALYALAVHTGMRQMELLGLKCEDVDLEGGLIRIQRTLTPNKGRSS